MGWAAECWVAPALAPALAPPAAAAAESASAVLAAEARTQDGRRHDRRAVAPPLGVWRRVEEAAPARRRRGGAAVARPTAAAPALPQRLAAHRKYALQDMCLVFNHKEFPDHYTLEQVQFHPYDIIRVLLAPTKGID